MVSFFSPVLPREDGFCALPDLEHGLAEVLAVQHTDETLGSVVDALGDVEVGLDAAVGDPGGELLLVLHEVGRAELGHADEETLDLELLLDDLEDALDALALLGRSVVLGDLEIGVVR